MIDRATSDLVLAWLWQLTWQIMLLVLVVLILQWLFRRWLTPGWSYALWLLVAGRLLLPVLPASSLSVYPVISSVFPDRLIAVVAEADNGPETSPTAPGLAQGLGDLTEEPGSIAMAETVDDSVRATDSSAHNKPLTREGVVIPRPEDESIASPIAAASTTLPPVSTAQQQTQDTGGWDWLSLSSCLLLIWLCGVLVMLVRLAISCLAQRRVYRGTVPCEDDGVNAILLKLRNDAGVRRDVHVRVSDQATVPYVQGVWNPKIVLPRTLIDGMTAAQLRWVLLHELLHIKRHDLVVVWGMILVRSVYWFNPAIWIGFNRVRMAQEVWCDRGVIEADGRDQQEAANAYGRVLLDVIAFVKWPASPRCAQAVGAGLGFRQYQLKERIGMLKRSRKNAVLSSVVGASVILASAGGFLTQADASDKGQGEPLPVVGAEREVPGPQPIPVEPRAIADRAANANPKFDASPAFYTFIPAMPEDTIDPTIIPYSNWRFVSASGEEQPWHKRTPYFMEEYQHIAGGQNGHSRGPLPSIVFCWKSSPGAPVDRVEFTRPGEEFFRTKEGDDMIRDEEGNKFLSWRVGSMSWKPQPEVGTYNLTHRITNFSTIPDSIKIGMKYRPAAWETVSKITTESKLPIGDDRYKVVYFGKPRTDTELYKRKNEFGGMEKYSTEIEIDTPRLKAYREYDKSYEAAKERIDNLPDNMRTKEEYLKAFKPAQDRLREQLKKIEDKEAESPYEYAHICLDIYRERAKSGASYSNGRQFMTDAKLDRIDRLEIQRRRILTIDAVDVDISQIANLKEAEKIHKRIDLAGAQFGAPSKVKLRVQGGQDTALLDLDTLELTSTDGLLNHDSNKVGKFLEEKGIDLLLNVDFKPIHQYRYISMSAKTIASPVYQLQSRFWNESPRACVEHIKENKVFYDDKIDCSDRNEKHKGFVWLTTTSDGTMLLIRVDQIQNKSMEGKIPGDTNLRWESPLWMTLEIKRLVKP